MTRKRNNPKKVGIGEYQFSPEEIELLGKIPDVSVAKIFRAPTWLIAQERTARGIPASSIRSKKQVKEVLQSLNAPRRYFKVLDLGGLSPRQKLHKERAEQREKKKREEQERKKREKQRSRPSKKPKAKKTMSKPLISEVSVAALPGQWKKPQKKVTIKVPKRFSGHPRNIDDFFEPESKLDKKRRQAVEGKLPYQGYPITRPLKNPRSTFAGLDRVLGAQVDQFQEDLLHNPWAAYFKFLGFAVGATAFSLAAVKAISALSGKIN